MNKKIVFFLILMIIVTTVAFANEEHWGEPKNYLSGDIGFIYLGLRYERLITPKISIGSVVYHQLFFGFYPETEVGVFGRFYIGKRFYTELGLGFHRFYNHLHYVHYDYSGYGSSRCWTGYISGFSISPGLGFKFDPGRSGGFFVSPGLIVPIIVAKTDIKFEEFSYPILTHYSFALYCSFGYAW